MHTGRKRAKYTAQACTDCKQRKVKCSGGEICVQCRVRGVSCVYESRHREQPPQPGGPIETIGSGLIRGQDVTSGPNSFQSLSADDAQSDLRPRPSVSSLYRLQDGYEGFASNHQLDDHGEHASLQSPAPDDSDTAVQTDSSMATMWELSRPPEHGQMNSGLASQLVAVQRLLKAPITLPSVLATPETGKALTLQLLPLSQVCDLLQSYFRVSSNPFPILDGPDTSTRILQFLDAMGLSEADYVLTVGAMTQPAMAALLCIILAIVEAFADSAPNSHPRPGWAWYTEAQNLLQNFSRVVRCDLDCLNCYVLSAYYLMISGCFGSAFEKVNLAVRLSVECHFNLQSTWGISDGTETLRRKRLWWGMYVLDAKISHHCGLAYSIPEQEIAVEALLDQRSRSAVSNPSLNSTTDDYVELEYLEHLVQLARIRRTIWDKIFSATAQRISTQGSETAHMDSKLVELASRLPETLTWQRKRLSSYLTGSETQMTLWRRLILSNEVTSLRLSLRQNAVSASLTYDSTLICNYLIKTQIGDIVFVAESGASPQTTSILMSTYLVDLVLQLILLCENNLLPNQTEETLRYFRTTCQTLQGLSQSHESARQALAMLSASVAGAQGASASFEQALSAPPRRQTEENSPPLTQSSSLSPTSPWAPPSTAAPAIAKSIFSDPSPGVTSQQPASPRHDEPGVPHIQPEADPDRGPGSGQTRIPAAASTSRADFIDQLEDVYRDLGFE